MKKPFLIFVIVFLFVGVAGIFVPAQAARALQGAQFFTPTPGPDGRITYFVQANDTCLRISLLFGISVDQIRSLNRLDENCQLREGQELILGFGGPAAVSPTPGPSPTATPVTPTPTPVNSGFAKICVLVYNDLNGDALRQETEPALEGGAISVTGANTAFSQTLTTAINSDPEAYQGICFDEVPEGKYNISAAIPDTYNPTRALNASVDVGAGKTIYMAFGAQSKEQGLVSPDTGTRSPSLGWVGGILLVAGGALAFFAFRMQRAPRKVQLPRR